MWTEKNSDLRSFRSVELLTDIVEPTQLVLNQLKKTLPQSFEN